MARICLQCLDVALAAVFEVLGQESWVIVQIEWWYFRARLDRRSCAWGESCGRGRALGDGLGLAGVVEEECRDLKILFSDCHGARSLVKQNVFFGAKSCRLSPGLDRIHASGNREGDLGNRRSDKMAARAEDGQVRRIQAQIAAKSFGSTPAALGLPAGWHLSRLMLRKALRAAKLRSWLSFPPALRKSL